MEMAAAALGKVFTGLVGGGGAAAAGAATGGASIGSTALTVLSGVAATVKILSTLSAGRAGANATIQNANLEAGQLELQAGQEKVKSTQRQTQMSRELQRILGENEVAFANAGIDISAGAARTSARAAKKRAVSELSIDRRDADLQAALYRIRGQGVRTRAASSASAQRGGALLSAVSTAADFGISLASRG